MQFMAVRGTAASAAGAMTVAQAATPVNAVATLKDLFTAVRPFISGRVSCCLSLGISEPPVRYSIVMLTRERGSQGALLLHPRGKCVASAGRGALLLAWQWTVRLRHQLSVLRRQLGPDGARFTPADNQALLARCSTGSRTGPRESRMGVSPNDLGLGE